MPFALLVVGLVLIVTGFQNTYKQMGQQVVSDFTGQGNFFYWLIAIGVIGALGYVKSLEMFSRAFMALIIIMIFISNKGFFSQINPQISAGSSTPILPAGGNATVSGSAASGGGFSLSNISQDATLAVDAASLF
jgi:hypothetical protein